MKTIENNAWTLKTPKSKILLSLLCVVSILFSVIFTGCGPKSQSGDTSGSKKPASSQSQPSDESKTDESTESKTDEPNS